VLVAGAVSLIGAWLLATGGGPTRPPTIGDGLVLLADLAWATGIALTPIFLVKTERPLTLAFSQHAVCAVLAAVASSVFETAAPPAVFLAAAPAILFAGLVSGGVGYTLQIVAQRYTPPAEAALILSMESVFAAIAGAIWFGESLTVAGAVGCGLILVGAIAAEAAPALAGRNVAGA
jgi:drug/metabolite transporter (DMT)-like permease